jgi:hypothetical protein
LLLRENPRPPRRARFSSMIASRLQWRGEMRSAVPAKIEVERVDASHFRVRVIEAGSESSHQVTLDPKDQAKFAGGSAAPKKLIRKSFEFLLEREPKESILSCFDLSVISRYFPEYEREIKKRLL